MADNTEEFNLNNLTDEQKGHLMEYLYKFQNRIADDTSQFVIPYIAMNDGHTPAQIKAVSKGLYKDVQRNPFLRKTGVFSAEGTIEDIDITPLVYYGTLQQAKIAPTLENIDVKLYFREPTLNKVPSPDKNGETGDTYIWRELPVGFHVYNNDTIYGYEWLVLQDNYAGTDGIYNLHMNIEDGIGVCKFAGTQAPINLAGVQYKIVITAKNLWNREFSLIDNMPLLKSLTANSDVLAPTVNAIKEYYANAVVTLHAVAKELFVADEDNPVLFADKDGVIITKLSLGDIKNLEEYVTMLRSDFDAHANMEVENAVKDSKNNLVGPHGIVNAGAKGNLDAKSVAGIGLSNGKQAVSENISGRFAYIPYVADDNSIGLGTTVNFYKRGANENPRPLYQRKFEDLATKKILNIIDIVGDDNLTELLYSLKVGTTSFNASLSKTDDSVILALTSGNDKKDIVELKTKKVSAKAVAIGNTVLDEASVNYVNGASTIAYKIPTSELLGIRIKDALGPELVPNINRDADGKAVSNLDTTDLEDRDLKVAAKSFTEDGFNTDTSIQAFDKLGSALQALYELPLGTYTYKRGQERWKEQIGIFVERVNQFRDQLSILRASGEDADGNISSENYLVHKCTTDIQSENPKVVDYDKGFGVTNNSKDQGSIFNERVENNIYTYTEEEIKSIAHYLDLMTGKQELSQEIRNTVGILLKAAKETQERLLSIETAVYGFDAKTIPGNDDAKKSFVNSHIAESLQSVINNSPLLLGLNRLIRAVCLELYDTTDLEKIDAETRSVVKDSDTLEAKITIKSRMDTIDDILSDLTNQASAITQYYINNVLNGESGHTYTDIVKDTIVDSETETLPVATEENIEEANDLLDLIEDSHKVIGDESPAYDKDHSWATLPSSKDINESQDVGFATVHDGAYKHSPNAEECGTVRTPVIETFEHEDIDAAGNKITRVWHKFKVDKVGDENTYLPVFQTKAVAWEKAKLERLSNKLSKVTEEIFGIDDVVAKYPNRTEVIRRNIANLVDDLYPNRSFAVEKPVSVNIRDVVDDVKLRTPFKKSKEYDKYDKAGYLAAPQTDEPVDTEEHTSIITHFDNEIFNFTLENSLFGKFGSDNVVAEDAESLDMSISDKYDSNGQITIERAKNEAGKIKFDSSKFVTDSVPNEGFGTYFKACSRLDIIENVLGLRNSYPVDIFYNKETILNAVGIKNTSSVLNDPSGAFKKHPKDVQRVSTGTYILGNYINELEFVDLRNVADRDVLIDSMLDATNTGYILSRKLKPVQDRVSTLESFADEISKGLGIVQKKLQMSDTDRQEFRRENKRFESQEVVEIFDKIGSAINGQTQELRLYDLDLTESYIGTEDHNADLWKIVKNSKDVVKSAYTVVPDIGTIAGETKEAYKRYSGYYEITGRFAIEPEYLNLKNKDLVPTNLGYNDSWTIRVYYVKQGTTLNINGADKNERAIFLRAKTPKTGEGLKSFFTGKGSLLNISGAENDESTGTKDTGWQNQTEYNIYKTINNLFTNMLTQDVNNPLYYQLMLLAHPVGSYYISSNTNDPAEMFGGVWKQITENMVLATGETIPITGSIGGSTVSKKFNVEVDLAEHSHKYRAVPESFGFGETSTTGTVANATGSVVVEELELNGSLKPDTKINTKNVKKVYAWYRES